MAKQSSSGETSTPLIVFLAIFVLATLTLGVLYYLETDKKNSAVAEAKKANDDKANADKLRAEEQDKVRLYRVLVGVADAPEVEELKNTRNEAKVKEEFDKIAAALPAKLKGLVDKQVANLVGQNKQLSLKPADILSWSALAAGKPDKEPELTLTDSIVRATSFRLLAESREATAQKTLDDATKSFQAQAAQAEAKRKELETTIAAVQKESKDALDKQAAEFAAIRKTYGDRTNEYVASEKKFQEDTTNLGIKLKESQDTGDKLKGRVDQFEERVEAGEDPFRNQKPLGRIVRREKGDSRTVYIDLGSADNVPVGLRFTVQPSNTPEAGIGGRLRPRIGSNGRPVIENGQPQYDMVPKGKIEVIAVEGEKLSRCRIVAEADPYRDRVEYGDLIYNTSWRKGKTDTVALYGVFDTNADGQDDVRAVIRDLQRMGIAVSAYFDLDQRKWIDPATGKPTAVTEQVMYAVEGAFPAASTGVDSLAGVRGELVTALAEARKQAKDRGVKVVKARQYFPQIGFEYRGGDASPDRVNQAFNRYLRGAAAPAGDTPPPMPEAKN